EVIVCSGLFLALYRWLIAKKVAFRMCRAYLIITMLLSAAIPAMNVPVYTSPAAIGLSEWQPTTYRTIDSAEEPEAVQEETAISAAAQTDTVSTVQTAKSINMPKIDFLQAAVLIYILAASASLALIVRSWIRIGRIRRKSELTYTDEYILAENAEIKTPFSFIRTVFMGYDYEEEEKIQILTHEASHVRHRHSMERMTLAVLRSVYWFNPFFRIAEKDLEEVQEWEADKDVLSHGFGLKTYRTTIFRQLFGYNPDISCGLNHSLTKQRFIMMTQSHRGKGAWIRLAATLPVIAVVFFAFGCGARSPQEAQAKAETDLADTTAIHLQMPCNPIGIMDRYESRPRHSVFSRRHIGIDFVLEEGDPIWAAADGHLVSIESGDETIVTYDKTTGITTFHYPENIFMPAETSLQPGKFNVGDVEVNVTGRDGMQEFRCGPESAGLTVTIMHEEGIRTVYKQVPYIILRPDRIKTGQMIGKAGKTAESTDVHLHFEVHKDGKQSL
ncbi:MAG: peptidoglycan DD-metalloendopeptidase family protein, partial [Bacteroidales bacterium]|nr:peptidoglycan DD-metalloendopeptidase family protein [Bacteroidales bacterium]